MGLLDKKELSASEEQYEFVSGENLDSFVAEFQEDKQEFQKPPEEEFEVSVEEIKPSRTQQKATTNMAKILIRTLDQAVSIPFALWALSEDISTFCAEDDDISELAEVWGYYLVEKGGELPPWVMASITTGMVLSKKVMAASSLRKENKALIAEKKRTAALESELRELKKQKQIENMRQEINTLKEDEQE